MTINNQARLAWIQMKAAETRGDSAARIHYGRMFRLLTKMAGRR